MALVFAPVLPRPSRGRKLAPSRGSLVGPVVGPLVGNLGRQPGLAFTGKGRGREAASDRDPGRGCDLRGAPGGSGGAKFFEALRNNNDNSFINALQNLSSPFPPPFPAGPFPLPFPLLSGSLPPLQALHSYPSL